MRLTLGDKIKELRKRDGRKQEDLAKALGISCQAISRWEQNGSYPDMEMIPAIANYFGITIDELFGYENDREKRIDELVANITQMNRKNNGVDINMDECIALARNAIIEFPANEKILLCLANVLYNAGYVRYGEYHLIDNEGYNVYDIERHRDYSEWKEAIAIYEKLLKTMAAGETRNTALCKLTQLYLNTGEHKKALLVIESAPTIYGTYDYLRINAFDGKQRAIASGEALLRLVAASSELIVGTMLSYEQNMSPCEKVQCIESAIGIFNHVCTDGNYGIYNLYIAKLYTLLSLYLWLDGEHNEAFEALDRSLIHFRKYESSNSVISYTAPLVKLVKSEKTNSRSNAISLATYWPGWAVQEDCLVRSEIQSDPRWSEWVEKLNA